MANHKSAAKRARQTKTKTLVNKIVTSKTRTMIKSLREAIESKDKKKAEELLPHAQGYLAKQSKIGIIKTNTAARKTSRLAQKVSAL